MPSIPEKIRTNNKNHDAVFRNCGSVSRNYSSVFRNHDAVFVKEKYVKNNSSIHQKLFCRQEADIPPSFCIFANYCVKIINITI